MWRNVTQPWLSLFACCAARSLPESYQVMACSGWGLSTGFGAHAAGLTAARKILHACQADSQNSM